MRIFNKKKSIEVTAEVTVLPQNENLKNGQQQPQQRQQLVRRKKGGLFRRIRKGKPSKITSCNDKKEAVENTDVEGNIERDNFSDHLGSKINAPNSCLPRDSSINTADVTIHTDESMADADGTYLQSTIETKSVDGSSSSETNKPSSSNSVDGDGDDSSQADKTEDSMRIPTNFEEMEAQGLIEISEDVASQPDDDKYPEYEPQNQDESFETEDENGRYEPETFIIPTNLYGTEETAYIEISEDMVSQHDDEGDDGTLEETVEESHLSTSFEGQRDDEGEEESTVIPETIESITRAEKSIMFLQSMFLANLPEEEDEDYDFDDTMTVDNENGQNTTTSTFAKLERQAAKLIYDQSLLFLGPAELRKRIRSSKSEIASSRISRAEI
jgi:hypothetical protein